jgi:hypothetical protein
MGSIYLRRLFSAFDSDKAISAFHKLPIDKLAGEREVSWLVVNLSLKLR